jgi:hypothetical protein
VLLEHCRKPGWLKERAKQRDLFDACGGSHWGDESADGCGRNGASSPHCVGCRGSAVVARASRCRGAPPECGSSSTAKLRDKSPGVPMTIFPRLRGSSLPRMILWRSSVARAARAGRAAKCRSPKPVMRTGLISLRRW